MPISMDSRAKAVTDEEPYDAEGQLAFTKEEWEAAMPTLTLAMNDLLKRYRSPIFIDHGDHGEPYGSGSFLMLGERRFILTNEHVVAARRSGAQLGIRFDGQDDLIALLGDHVELPWPWDLALIPVSEQAWSACEHTALAITVDQILPAHAAAPTEVFAFSGYAGERTHFVFGEMQFGATTSLAREVQLNDHPEIDPRFHFGLAYLPDQATSVIGGRGLPRPDGMSGSAVWNTRFVEARLKGLDWSADLAAVTGVAFGWPSGQGAIAATRAEHLRSFMLAAMTTDF